MELKSSRFLGAYQRTNAPGVGIGEICRLQRYEYRNKGVLHASLREVLVEDLPSGGKNTVMLGRM